MRFAPFYWRHWWAVHLTWWSSDVRLLLRRTAQEFVEDRCTQLAASISYYVLFSIFPLTILAVAISGLILTDDSLRAQVVDDLFDVLPLSADEGREDLEDAIDGIATGLSAIGLLSLLGLAWSASGMMGALRHALNQAWDIESRRPFVRGKLLDLVMVTGVGLLIGASIAATIVLQVARRVSDRVADALGPLGGSATFSLEVIAILVPLVISFITFMIIFKVVPDVRTRYRFIWPGALLSAVLFEVVKNGFALYLRNFGNYDAVYGSLGAVVAFLFFVYISANIVLLGAEMAAEWPRVMHGHYDAGLEQAKQPHDASRRRRLRSALRGLVQREEETPEHIPDLAPGEARGEARRRRKAEELAHRLGRATDQEAEPAAADPVEAESDADTGEPRSAPRS